MTLWVTYEFDTFFATLMFEKDSAMNLELSDEPSALTESKF